MPALAAGDIWTASAGKANIAHSSTFIPGNSSESSACVNASAVLSDPKTHVPISMITASSVTIISVACPRNTEVPDECVVGRRRNDQM